MELNSTKDDSSLLCQHKSQENDHPTVLKIFSSDRQERVDIWNIRLLHTLYFTIFSKWIQETRFDTFSVNGATSVALLRVVAISRLTRKWQHQPLSKNGNDPKYVLLMGFQDCLLASAPLLHTEFLTFTILHLSACAGLTHFNINSNFYLKIQIIGGKVYLRS